MVLGLLSIVLSFVLMLMPYIPLALGVIGLILSVKTRKTGSIMAAAGLVLSIIGVVLSGAYMVVWIACTGLVSSITY